jgi:hypothetical protein
VLQSGHCAEDDRAVAGHGANAIAWPLQRRRALRPRRPSFQRRLLPIGWSHWSSVRLAPPRDLRSRDPLAIGALDKPYDALIEQQVAGIHQGALLGRMCAGCLLAVQTRIEVTDLPAHRAPEMQTSSPKVIAPSWGMCGPLNYGKRQQDRPSSGAGSRFGHSPGAMPMTGLAAWLKSRGRLGGLPIGIPVIPDPRHTTGAVQPPLGVVLRFKAPKSDRVAVREMRL